MTITIGSPASGRLGWGMRVAGTCSGFTVDPGDKVVGTLSDAATGLIVVNQFQEPLDGGGNFIGTMGLINPGGVIESASNGGLAHGTALQLFLEWFRDPFSVVETSTQTGWDHDPTSQAPRLLASPAHDPMLDDILANVQGGSFKNPLIGVSVTVAVAGNPFTGGAVFDLPLPLTGIVAGLTWNTVTTPAYVGGTVGVIQDASRRLLQLAVFHSLFGGATFADQTFESHGLTGTCWFDSYDPTGVSVFIWPGYEVEFSWVIVP